MDVDDQITNIFWADPKMVVDYDLFGDVVCFDTTYQANKNHRPLAPIIGVNHHRQTVVFRTALFYDETAKTFSWLFRTLLKPLVERSQLQFLLIKIQQWLKQLQKCYQNLIIVYADGIYIKMLSKNSTGIFRVQIHLLQNLKVVCVIMSMRMIFSSMGINVR